MPTVQILMTPGCAGCPQAEQVVDEVVGEFADASWEEIDISDAPDIGVRHGVMSVPAVLVDDELFCTGVPDRDELRSHLSSIV